MASSEITLEAVPAVSDIRAEDWDACANPTPDPNSLDNLDTLASPGAASNSTACLGHGYNPFVSHAFFAAAEASGSACPAPAGVRGIFWPGSTAPLSASCPAI